MAFISNINIGNDTYGNRAVAIPSGAVDNTSTETAFTATVPGITELKTGVCCFIKNGVVNSAAACTLNINGLGAKPIYSSMEAATAVTTTFKSAYTMLFIYDENRVSGGCWMMYYGYNAGYTSNVAQGQGYAICSTAVGTKAKTASLSSYALVAYGIVTVQFTNGNTAASPTLNINSKGAKAIYWNGAAVPTDMIKAGDWVTMYYSSQYHIVGIYNGNRGFATTTPLMDGTAAIGTSTEYARADHVHPHDDIMAPISSPAFTGIPTAPTPTVSDNSQQIATTEWVKDRISGLTGAMHFKGTAAQTLTDGGTENAASSVIGSAYLGESGDVYLQYNNSTEEYIWNGSTWEKFGLDTLPTASASTPGITKLGASGGAATYDHVHGNITNDGKVTTTVAVAASDRILITDNSDSSKVIGGPAFGSSTTYFLNNAGSWAVPEDTKVTQAAAITTNGNYPVLLGYDTGTTAVTNTVNKASTLVYNPSTKKLLINNATVATVADLSNSDAEITITDFPFAQNTNLGYTSTLSWSSVASAADSCAQINLLFDDGVYNRGRLTSYYYDKDYNIIYFSCGAFFAQLAGEFSVQQDGSTQNLKIRWIPLSANDIAY